MACIGYPWRHRPLCCLVLRGSSIVNIRVKMMLVPQQLGPQVGSGAPLHSVCVFSCVVFLWEIELNWRLVWVCVLQPSCTLRMLNIIFTQNFSNFTLYQETLFIPFYLWPFQMQRKPVKPACENTWAGIFVQFFIMWPLRCVSAPFVSCFKKPGDQPGEMAQVWSVIERRSEVKAGNEDSGFRQRCVCVHLSQVTDHSHSKITQLCVFSCGTEIIFRSHQILALHSTLPVVAVTICISVHLNVDSCDLRM